MATILILDDRATNRNIYARLAAAIEDNVSAEVFADPVDALEWLESNRVDLVITDYKMPGMDGAEFTRRFRAMPNNRHVPVVVITAYDDRSFRLRALDAGATDFLQSPVDHFEIVVRARNLLALGRRMGAGSPSAAAAAGVPDPVPAQASRTEPAGTRGRPAIDARRILDAMPALVSATDREGRCVFANAAFAAGPVAGGTERSRGHDASVFATGRAVAPYREDVPGDGRRLLTSKVPLRDQTGAVVAVLTTSVELPAGTAEPAREEEPAPPGVAV
ncbi:MAG: response regulator [Acetobacteraceae bacterium]|nr:response regulator [Acetobacteraceae bacterium]